MVCRRERALHAFTSSTRSFRQLVCGRRARWSLLSPATWLAHHRVNVYLTAGRQEGRWINGKVSGHICSMAWKEVENRDSMKWLEYAATMNNGNEARDPTEDEARVLSHFQCADGSTEYIEPLTGVARHPFARVGCKRASKDWTSGLPSEYPKGVDIINSSYLVLPNACNSKQARRALFFDMGCGIDRGNAKSYNKTKDGDQPDSIVKFADMFAARCIHFDRIFAWEKKPYAAEEWWGSKPPELRSKLTFFNLGVPQEPTQGASSFLRLLNATVRPSDYVVVKLDIDTPHVELSIVRALIADAKPMRPLPVSWTSSSLSTTSTKTIERAGTLDGFSPLCRFGVRQQSMTRSH